MSQFTLKEGTERRTVEADLHSDYLVELGTKIPLLNQTLLAGAPEKDQQRIAATLENARSDDSALAELWRNGEVLRYAYERPQAKFNYLDFLHKFQNREFDRHPVEHAFSALEREHLLATLNLDDFGDSPTIVVSMLRSLSWERLENLLNSHADKFTQFIFHYGTPTDMQDFLAMIPEERRNQVIAKDQYALMLEAMNSHKQGMLEPLLECVPEWKQQGVPKDLQRAILTSVVKDTIHPNFHEHVYREMLPITLAACKAEGNIGAVEHAYKLAVLFSSPGSARSYLEKWAERTDDTNRQPVHDALLFSLPDANDHYDAKAWATLAVKHGMAALKYFGNAEAIEREIIHLYPGTGENLGVSLASLSPKELALASGVCSFARVKENPKWAKLCASLGVGERVFNRGLGILANAKTTDNMPDIGIILGNVIGKPGYYMRKLEATDPRNLLIGKMVDCCNHIDGGETGYMAEAQVTSPDAACYVIFKEARKGTQDDEQDQPVAKVTGWMSTRNNLVFNSWERLDGHADLCRPFLKEAGDRILKGNPQIAKVLLGRNRDNVQAFVDA